MYFCGQSIKSAHVVGVGMLQRENHPDDRMYNLFLRVRYTFKLYLRNYCVDVYSDWHDLKGEVEEVEIAEKMIEAFKSEHKKVFDAFA